MRHIDEQTGALIREGLTEAQRYLPVLVAGIQETVGLLQKGGLEQGAPQLAACLEGINWVMDLVGKVEFLVGAEKTSSETIVRSLQDNLTAIYRAIDNMDMVTVADILEYEVLPPVTQYSEVLTALQRIMVEVQ